MDRIPLSDAASVLTGSPRGTGRAHACTAAPHERTRLRPGTDEAAALRVDLLAEVALAETGRAMTGAVQLAFPVLLVSGLYLRLPKIVRWRMLRSRIPFRRDDPNTRARTFFWHHLSAFRAVLPIRLIVVSGAEIFRVWAGNIVMKAVGADTTTCGGPGFGHGRGRPRRGGDAPTRRPAGFGRQYRRSATRRSCKTPRRLR